MASDRSGLGDSWKLDADKPWYHVMPRSGWLNDPNGPIYYQSRYHVYDPCSPTLRTGFCVHIKFACALLTKCHLHIAVLSRQVVK